MKNVLVITFSNLKNDARVKRQISFFGNGYEVTAACYGSPKEFSFIQINPPRLSLINKAISGILLLFQFYEKAYQMLYGQHLNLKKDFDLIVANDIESLPLAFHLKGNAKIIFDAHEYAPRHFEDKLSWRIFFQGFNTYLCKKYIQQVDGMITIGQGIADEYQKHFGIKPVVITNAPKYQNLEPQPVDPKKIKLVHQGIANPSRKLELMIELMDLLDDRFHLDLMLMEPTFKSGKIYLEKLKRLITGKNRINLVPPQSTNELIGKLNQYDIGIVLIPPINFNYQNTLPNKFFECIQARIALAIGPIPEMKKITEHYSIGIVSETFDPKSLADDIMKLTEEQINLFKNNTKIAATELNAEKNEVLFNNLINQVLNR
ncbi:MAG TPA: hypothetical protein DGG95_06985 [Cytophagales bacterium]|jgi:hypothetical protein|nr:hypothetical protein [Cytophagales bacterium]